MYLVSSILLLVVGGIIVRLVNIQFVNGEEIKKMATYKTTDIFTIEANRGNIYDDHGSLLATSVPKYDIYFDPVAVNEAVFASELVPLSKKMSEHFGRSATYYENLLEKPELIKDAI